MAYLPKSVEKRKLSEDSCWEDRDFLCDESSDSPKNPMEQEKRVRREIANSNERRRMQSINAGFLSLKVLIPHQDGEKLSKAAILQQTAEHISTLEHEKTRLLSHNAQLKRMLSDLGRHVHLDSDTSQPSPPPKRKKRDTESSDEGISLGNEDLSSEELRKELIELRQQLDRERRLRTLLEEQTRGLESRVYPEHLREIASQVQASMKYHKEKQRYIDEERKLREEMRDELQRARPKPLDEDEPKPEDELKPAAEETVSTPATPTTVSSTSSSPDLEQDVKKEKEEGKSSKESPKNSPSLFDQSMSRKNLETIVEAIRQIEGDYLFKNLDSESRDAQPSESDEKESVIGSDQEDLKSESGRDSGRDSPVHLPVSKNSLNTVSTSEVAPLDLHVQQPVTMATLPHIGVHMLAAPATIAVAHPVTDNSQLVSYPMAMQLLHRQVLPSHQYITRPGVIVQKSS